MPCKAVLFTTGFKHLLSSNSTCVCKPDKGDSVQSSVVGRETPVINKFLITLVWGCLTRQTPPGPKLVAYSGLRSVALGVESGKGKLTVDRKCISPIVKYQVWRKENLSNISFMILLYA